MRKIFYLGIFLLGFTSAKAQENRGYLIPAKIIQRSVMVGGSLSGAYNSITDTRNGEKVKGSKQNFALDAKAGYFAWDDIGLGLRASVNHSRQEMDGQNSNSSTTVLAGPFVRYYLDNGIFGEGSAAVGVNNKPNTTKTDIAEYRAGVGYAIFINPKVAVEPALLVSYYQEVRKGERNSKTTEIGPLLNIGVQVYLYRERKFKL